AKADRIGDGFVAQTGALDAITKPFSPEALLAVTGHALTRAAQLARDTLPPPAPVPDERISSVLPLAEAAPPPEPPPETSPAALAAAARAIAERLGRALADHLEMESPAESIAARFSPDALFA